jgi:hypothetical protein
VSCFPFLNPFPSLQKLLLFSILHFLHRYILLGIRDSIHKIPFFRDYECDLEARVLQNILLERLAKKKHSSLLGLFISCEENKVLYLRPKCNTSFSLSFSNGPNRLQRLYVESYSILSLVGPLVSY